MLHRFLTISLATLLGSACIVDDAEDITSIERSIIWACTGADTWTRSWYRDSRRAVEIGTEECLCDGSVVRHGTISGYYRQVGGESCTGGGGGGGGGGGDPCAPAASAPSNVPPICSAR